MSKGTIAEGKHKGGRADSSPGRSPVGLVAAAAAPAAATAAASSTAATTAAAATARAAAATCGLVRIADGEPAPHQPVDVVDLGSLNQWGALGVYQHSNILGLDHEVVGLSLRLDSHRVLNTSVRTGHDHHAEHRAFAALLLENGTQPLGGLGGDLYDLSSRQVLTSETGRVPYLYTLRHTSTGPARASRRPLRRQGWREAAEICCKLWDFVGCRSWGDSVLRRGCNVHAAQIQQECGNSATILRQGYPQLLAPPGREVTSNVGGHCLWLSRAAIPVSFCLVLEHSALTRASE